MLLLAVGLFYTLAYLGHPDLPGNNAAFPKEGWWGFWDQSQYLKSAAAWARLDFSPDSHWYPLGMGAIGGVFYPLAPQHAFFVPSLCFVIISAWLLWQITLRWLSRIEALLLAVVFLATHRWLITHTLVLPWNTLPTQCATYAVIYLLLFKRTPAALVFASSLVAIIYAIRPADAVILAPVLACMTLRLPTLSTRLRYGLIGASIVILAVLAVLTSKILIYDSPQSPYDVVSRKIGFLAQPIWLKAYWILVRGDLFFHEQTTGILFRYPWLWLAVPGLVYLARREGWEIFATSASGFLSFFLYLAYNDFHAGNIYRFGLIHYLAWTFPLLFVSGYCALSTARKSRTTLGLIIASGILCVATLGWKLVFQPATQVEVRAKGNAVEIRSASHGPVEVAVTGLRTEPMPLIRTMNGKPVLRFRDFVVPVPHDQFRILVTTPGLIGDGLIVEASEPIDPARVTVSAISTRWKLAIPDSLKFTATLAKVSAVHQDRTEDVDFTGPQGRPDGRPDYELLVTGSERALALVSDWELERFDAPGMWTTRPNPHGWWPILVTKADPGKRQIFVPDHDLLTRESQLRLRGFGTDRSLLFDVPVQ